jgi:pSer/pThr/pTyr-binding forkhead associated (FHA) protein
MAVTIVVRAGGEGTPLSLTLDAPRLVIGRGEGCEVRLPDPSVSHRHASLRQRGGEYLLVDEGSTNGTYLGPVRLPPQTPRAVRSGELMRVGRIWLEIRIEAAIVKGGGSAAKELALELVTRGLAAQGEEPWPRVVVLEGPDEGRTVTLRDPGRRYVIGRSKEADLPMEDAATARRHVEIARKGCGLVVQDLGSATGALLDGQPLGAREITWRAGQELVVGQNVLGFESPAALALAELERSPDEQMRPGDAPPPPSSEEDPIAEETPAPPSTSADETPAPGFTDDELSVPIRRGSAAAKARREGAWGAVDGAVVALALGVMALSLAAAWWLFGR